MIRSGRYRCLFAALCATIALMGCAPSPEEPRNLSQDEGETLMTLTIQSSAFQSDSVIPKRFTGDGEDVSPQLTWSGLPDGAT